MATNTLRILCLTILFLVPPVELKVSINSVNAIFEFADQLIALGDEIAFMAGDKMEEKIDELGKNLNVLMSQVKNLESNVETLINMIKENPYTILITQHIEKIRSCDRDLRNYLNQTNHRGAIENLRMCYTKRENVRALGDYLSGVAIAGSEPLMDLYVQKEGFCNGITIVTMFQYLYSYFIDGCIAIVKAEKLKFGNTSNLVRNECKTQRKEISKYMDTLYRQCAKSSCKTFQEKANMALLPYKDVISSDVKTKIKELYPWYNFFVIQMKRGQRSRFFGNYSAPRSFIQSGTKWFDIYFVDIFRPIYDRASWNARTEDYVFGLEADPIYVIDYDNEDMSLCLNMYFPGMKYQSFFKFVKTNATFCDAPPIDKPPASKGSTDTPKFTLLALTVFCTFLTQAF